LAVGAAWRNRIFKGHDRCFHFLYAPSTIFINDKRQNFKDLEAGCDKDAMPDVEATATLAGSGSPPNSPDVKQPENNVELDNLLARTAEDISDFWSSESHRIKYLDNPSTEEFLREAVAAYHPVIIRNAVNHWPALQKWNLDFFSDTYGDMDVAINITPDGLGDCVKMMEDGSKCFVYPLDHTMKMGDFCSMLRERNEGDAVPYLSQQDNNFNKSFFHIMEDIEPSFALANAAFQLSGPEAVNLWIGDERATSSLHKDFFENMYVVIEGEKTFTLLPPADIAFLKEDTFSTQRYVLAIGSAAARPKEEDLQLTAEGCPAESIGWIDIMDVDGRFLSYSGHNSKWQHLHPIRVTVRAGETLYLPAMWYHQVSQNCATIAVNYWYEMKFDFRYVFHQMCRRVGVNKNEKEPTLGSAYDIEEDKEEEKMSDFVDFR
jgi:jumonji domain-containing protein 7